MIASNLIPCRLANCMLHLRRDEMRANSLSGMNGFFSDAKFACLIWPYLFIQFDVVTPPPSRVGTPVPERTVTPFLDERGPKTQLILLNRKSSLRSVSVISQLFGIFSTPPLTGETATGTMVAETEACDCCVLFKAEACGTGPHDWKHELSFAPLLQLPLFNFRLSNCFRSKLYITMRPLLLVTVSSLSYSRSPSILSTLAPCP